MKYLLAILIICITQLLYSQKVISGAVKNAEAEPMVGATVILLSIPDSTLVKYSLADHEGKFTLDNISPNEYLIQVSYLGHDNVEKRISLKENNNFTNITMYPSTELLQEVTIKAEHIPMGIRGDTISYNASAFPTKDGDSVEELLKNLPGIEVERNGNIKAQGEKVEKVLIDGKEFFGDDPKIATRNLEAKAIEKVEVFNKKSELAEFTGVEDGEEEKTINLKLKEEYKNSGFGKAEFAGGTKTTYNGKLNYNRFSPKMQSAIISSANNIGEEVFSINEYIKFMGGIQNFIAMSGSTGIGLNPNSIPGQNDEKGIRNNLFTGINYNYDFSEKIRFVSNYILVNERMNLENNIYKKSYTDIIEFNTSDSLEENRNAYNHKLITKLEFNPSPIFKFKIKNDLMMMNSSTAFMNNILQNSTEGIVNNSLINNNTSLKNINYKGAIIANVKLKKKGRNLSSKINYVATSTNNRDTINTTLDRIEAIENIKQFQTTRYSKSMTAFNLNYVEPISKFWFISSEFTMEAELETPNKKVLDLNNNNSIIQNLSATFVKNINRNKLGFNINRNTKKTKFKLGANLLNLNFDVEDVSNEISSHFSKNYLTPSLSINNRPKQSTSFGFSYDTDVIVPQLNQLLPIPDNTNPNFLIIGNLDLLPNYQHKINTNYHIFDQFSLMNFFASVSYTINSNAVVYDRKIDRSLIQTTTAVNTKKYNVFNLNTHFGKPIRLLKIKYNIQLNYNHTNQIGFIEGHETNMQQSNSTLNLKIENRNKQKIDIQSGLRFSATINKNEINTNFNQRFYNYDWFIDSKIVVAKNSLISITFDHKKFLGRFFAENRSFQLLNIAFSQAIKNGKILFKISANDILNQNLGLQRSANANNILEENYNTLSRYFMIGVNYRLSKVN